MTINAQIILTPFMSIEEALKLWKKAIQKSGALDEARRHEEFISQSARRRKKSAVARKRQHGYKHESKARSI